MYQQWSPKERRRPPSASRKEAIYQLEQRTKAQLQQLLLSIGLFLMVFLGQGVFPDSQLRETILQQINGETDFQAAFTKLGMALSAEESIFGEVGDFCLEVFGAVPMEDTSSQKTVAVFHPDMNLIPATTTKLFLDSLEEEAAPVMAPEPTPQLESQPEPEPEPLPIGTIIASYDSELPETHSMDHYYLGDRPMICPVYSMVTSEFGARVSPITGDLAIHSGVDLRGATGTPIVAWSDGTVDYVGNHYDLGLYFRLSHGDDITSFYAHCSEILVSQGQKVVAGETIALVGETGQVTGAHLHFELSWNDIRLNPLHYMEYQGIVE